MYSGQFFFVHYQYHDQIAIEMFKTLMSYDQIRNYSGQNFHPLW